MPNRLHDGNEPTQIVFTFRGDPKKAQEFMKLHTAKTIVALPEPFGGEWYYQSVEWLHVVDGDIVCRAILNKIFHYEVK